MPTALETTRDDLVRALTPTFAPPTGPVLLADVLRMKRARGDADCADFERIARDYGARLNATIRGAAWAMRQWVAKGHPSEAHQAMREAFLADLERVLAGDLTGWDGLSGEAA